MKITKKHAEITANLVRGLLSGNFPEEVKVFLLTLGAMQNQIIRESHITKYSKEQLDAFESALTHYLQECYYNDENQQYSFIYCEYVIHDKNIINPISAIVKNSLNHAGIAINNFIFPFTMSIWINQKELTLSITAATKTYYPKTYYHNVTL
jgi:hypothetical protein